MGRLRFTLAQLMAVVIFIALGFGALKNADMFWASAIYTLAFLMLSVAALGALARTGRARLVWAGFAVFGWARFFFAGQPLSQFNYFNLIPAPGLLTERASGYLLRYLWTPGGSYGVQAPGPFTFDTYDPWWLGTPGGIYSVQAQVLFSLEIIFFGWIGSIVGFIREKRARRLKKVDTLIPLGVVSKGSKPGGQHVHQFVVSRVRRPGLRLLAHRVRER
jgi:hypothetical protein